ncbi:MAG: hypothetical protein JF566_00760 [Bradyrhizobium sp.]|nr:hypothetical protein [Bradyrhizobium sp.]
MADRGVDLVEFATSWLKGRGASGGREYKNCLPVQRFNHHFKLEAHSPESNRAGQLSAARAMILP